MVMAIDDSPEVLLSLGQALDGEFDLRVAASAAEGLTMAGELLPDLILLDLNMPRMDGRTALRHIRESEKLKHIPIVILTTSKDDREVNNAYLAGANSFITKPSDFEEFVATLTKAEDYWAATVRLPNSSN